VLLSHIFTVATNHQEVMHNQSINQSTNLYCKNIADRTQRINRQTLKKDNTLMTTLVRNTYKSTSTMDRCFISNLYYAIQAAKTH